MHDEVEKDIVEWSTTLLTQMYTAKAMKKHLTVQKTGNLNSRDAILKAGFSFIFLKK